MASLSRLSASCWAVVLSLAPAALRLLSSLLRSAVAAYRLPTFNLMANVWRWGNAFINPPDVQSACNLAFGRRAEILLPPMAVPAGPTHYYPAGITMTLLLPKLTDVRSHAQSPTNPDLVEVPAGSGRFYVSWAVDDIGKGFPNEHRAAALLPFGPLLSAYFGVGAWGGPPNWPTPYP